jgi:transcriptional regulator with XRE-family HTH domain
MKRRPFQERIGDALRRQREAQKYSQEAFADRIRMHRAYYGAIERGRKNLQLSTLERVCAGLDVPVWEIIREAESR